jgi:hypothetical protein
MNMMIIHMNGGMGTGDKKGILRPSACSGKSTVRVPPYSFNIIPAHWRPYPMGSPIPKPEGSRRVYKLTTIYVICTFIHIVSHSLDANSIIHNTTLLYGIIGARLVRINFCLLIFIIISLVGLKQNYVFICFDVKYF